MDHTSNTFIAILCGLLHVSVSGFDDWDRRRTSHCSTSHRRLGLGQTDRAHSWDDFDLGLRNRERIPTRLPHLSEGRQIALDNFFGFFWARGSFYRGLS